MAMRESEIRASNGQRPQITWHFAQNPGVRSQRHTYREAVLTAPRSGGLVVYEPGAAGARRAAEPPVYLARAGEGPLFTARSQRGQRCRALAQRAGRLVPLRGTCRSEEHTSELQS